MKSKLTGFTKFLVVTLSTFILSACSTTQTSLNSAKPVPNQRFLSFQNKSEENQAELTVTRDQGIAASSCYYAVFIDGVLSARMDVSEQATFKLRPGKRSLKITRDPLGAGLCSLGDDSVEKEIVLESSQKSHVRLSLDLSGQPYIKNYEQ